MLANKCSSEALIVADRIILHCDLNNFFASVECLGRDDLKGKPVAVAGSVEQRHGIILAKNEVAKKHGVKTAEAIWQAQQKCPSLVLLPPHYELYNRYSQQVREIYDSYTDTVEPFGIDECWLDVTGSTMLFGSGEKIAEQIRQRVKKETGLTVSVGVSFN
ncbi:MAG: DNA polymerase IV, partial [Clostridia bacterium]|nr:DNA polymerase IV [Clostridia bacterium]